MYTYTYTYTYTYIHMYILCICICIYYVYVYVYVYIYLYTYICIKTIYVYTCTLLVYEAFNYFARALYQPTQAFAFSKKGGSFLYQALCLFSFSCLFFYPSIPCHGREGGVLHRRCISRSREREKERSGTSLRERKRRKTEEKINSTS